MSFRFQSPQKLEFGTTVFYIFWSIPSGFSSTIRVLFHFSSLSPRAPTEMIFLMAFVKTMFRKCVSKRDVKSPRFMSASRIFQVGKFLCYCKLSHVKNVNHKLVQPQNTFFSFVLLKSPKALLDIEVF